MCDGDVAETGLSKYYGVFVAAQVLHGVGASPLYTLNVAFLDDNVKQASLGAYVGEKYSSSFYHERGFTLAIFQRSEKEIKRI